MNKLDFLVSRFEELSIGLLLLTASAILFANVAARYLLNLGFPWAEEVVRYEIIWMVFLGGSAAARRGMHIGVDIIAKFASPAIRKSVLVAVNAIALVFCACLAYYGAELVAQTRMFGQVTPALQVPMWMIQLAIPIGSTLMAIRFGQHLYRELAGEVFDAQVESIG